MRIAQKMMARNYINTIHRTQTKQAESMERGTTGVKFTKLSQNVSDGVRAMRTQEARIRSEANLNTVESLILEFDQVDASLGSIDDILKTVQEKTLRALNEPNGVTAQEVLSQEIASLKEQVLQFVNLKFGDRYLFSGTENAEPAFAADADGRLTFNGVRVDEIYRENDIFYYDAEPANPGDPAVKTVVPDSGDVYMDVGLGMLMNGGKVDTRTAFNASVSGLDVLGFGPAGADGAPGNVYDLLTDLTTAVHDGVQDDMRKLFTKLVTLTDNSRMARTEAGVRANFLENTRDRLEVEIDNLGEMESGLITADLADESVTQKTLEYTWLATLQLGAQLLPTSLLDFLR